MEKENFEAQPEVSDEPWTADELAQFLGVKKGKPNGAAKYVLDAQNSQLLGIIKSMIDGHEKAKRERLGLKGSGVVVPMMGPFNKR